MASLRLPRSLLLFNVLVGDGSVAIQVGTTVLYYGLYVPMVLFTGEKDVGLGVESPQFAC